MILLAPRTYFLALKHLEHTDDEIYTVSTTDGVVTCLGGLKVLPDYTFASAPPLDILFVPGTSDPTPQIQNSQLLEWVKTTSDSCEWIAGVCTGAAILLASGVAKGKRITTHWGAIEQLRQIGGATILEGLRYVVDGNLVTSAGVTAGIDQALWLMGRLYGAHHAREIRHILDYYPAPPYAAEA